MTFIRNHSLSVDVPAAIRVIVISFTTAIYRILLNVTKAANGQYSLLIAIHILKVKCFGNLYSISRISRRICDMM